MQRTLHKTQTFHRQAKLITTTSVLSKPSLTNKIIKKSIQIIIKGLVAKISLRDNKLRTVDQDLNNLTSQAQGIVP